MVTLYLMTQFEHMDLTMLEAHLTLDFPVPELINYLSA